MDNEIWKPARGLEQLVYVSNCGRARVLERRCPYYKRGQLVYQTRPAKILSPCLGQNGYYYVTLKTHGKKRKYLLHRLLGFAFVSGGFDGATINHIDGNKTNNRIENLEWVSLAENTRLQWKTGLINLRGDNHPSSILTERKVHKIKKMLSSGASPCSIAKLYAVSDAAIYQILKGKNWAHVH